MALQPGDKAPDFTLTQLAADGPQLVTLSDNFGKSHTLVLFVPMAFTSVCTDELCAVTKELSGYGSLNAAVYGISGDNPFAQAEWAKKSGIDVPLLSDYEHKVAADYGIAYDSFLPDKNLPMGGVPKRSAFIIDKDGVIQYAEASDNPGQLPDFDAIKAKLGELG